MKYTCFVNFCFAAIIAINTPQIVLGDQSNYTCNFVQACDDIGNGCALPALRLNVDHSMVLFEYETESENRQILLNALGFDGLTLLTISPEGRARLSEHRGIETTSGRAISYHGICNN